MKTVKVEWKDFFNGTATSQPDRNNLVLPVLAAAAVALFVAEPALASGWDTAKTATLSIADKIAYGVIVFTGGSWMFGHRTRALDLLLSCGIGYIIIRHADDIEHFFQTI